MDLHQLVQQKPTYSPELLTNVRALETWELRSRLSFENNIWSNIQKKYKISIMSVYIAWHYIGEVFFNSCTGVYTHYEIDTNLLDIPFCTIKHTEVPGLSKVYVAGKHAGILVLCHGIIQPLKIIEVWEDKS